MIIQSTKEMKLIWGYDNILLQILFEDILIAFPEIASHPEIGSDEHYKIVWNFIIDLLLGIGMGTDTKGSRWWNFETDSKTLIRLRLPLLILFSFIGGKKMVQDRWK